MGASAQELRQAYLGETIRRVDKLARNGFTVDEVLVVALNNGKDSDSQKPCAVGWRAVDHLGCLPILNDGTRLGRGVRSEWRSHRRGR